MSEQVYYFYMQECDSKGVLLAGSTQKNLEVDFNGLKYCKAEGLNKIGKPRIYTEKYSDSDRLRVHIPEELTNEATTVTFTFYFVGSNRYATYNEFVEYVRNGFHRYYDTCRQRYLYFCVTSEIKPAKEQFIGGTPYLELQLQVQNIFGRTFDTAKH